MNEEQKKILEDIFENTEALDRITIILNTVFRDVIIVYEDLDDEWFRELKDAACCQ